MTETGTSLDTALPNFRSHKIVRAGKVLAINNVEDRTELVLQVVAHVEDGDKVHDSTWHDVGSICVPVTAEWIERWGSKCIGGYFVHYGDGYMSWSPALAFEAGYVLEDYAKVHDAALDLMKATLHEIGKRINMPEGSLYKDFVPQLEKLLAAVTEDPPDSVSELLGQLRTAVDPKSPVHTLLDQAAVMLSKE